jgi:hypothetical protein
MSPLGLEYEELNWGGFTIGRKLTSATPEWCQIDLRSLAWISCHINLVSSDSRARESGEILPEAMRAKRHTHQAHSAQNPQ